MTAAVQTQKEATQAVEAYQAGFLDGVRYATRTSSWTRAPSAYIRDAYQAGFAAGLLAWREAQAAADKLYSPRKARLYLVK